MSAKWTPGPWTILPEECNKPYIRIRGTVLGHRYKIANALTPCDDQREADETRANARLIAAAPELAEALAELIAAMNDYESEAETEAPEKHRAMMRKARVALAKAGA